jgi:hypothetical protein
MSVLGQSTFETFVSGRPQIGFFLCSGMDPRPSWKQKLKVNRQFVIISIVTVTAYVFVFVKVKLYKRQEQQLPTISHQRKNTWALPSISHLIEKQTLVDFATVAITLSFYGLLLWIFFYWNRISQPEKLTEFPNYLIVHFVQYEIAFVWHIVVLSQYFRKSKSMRTTIMNLPREEISCIT